MTAKPVDWMTLDLRPIAHCGDCDWQPFMFGREREDAKRHARTHPGHVVLVDKIKRTTYSVRALTGGEDQ